MTSQYDDVIAAAASIARSSSDLPSLGDDAEPSTPKRKKRKKKKNRKGKTLQDSPVISENVAASENYEINGDVSYSRTTSTVTEAVVVPDVDSTTVSAATLPSVYGELRQRNVGNVMNGLGVEMVSEESGDFKKDDNVKEEVAENRSTGKEVNSEQRVEMNGRKLEKDGTLDWKKLMAEDPNCKSII